MVLNPPPPPPPPIKGPYIRQSSSPSSSDSHMHPQRNYRPHSYRIRQSLFDFTSFFTNVNGVIPLVHDLPKLPRQDEFSEGIPLLQVPSPFIPPAAPVITSPFLQVNAQPSMAIPILPTDPVQPLVSLVPAIVPSLPHVTGNRRYPQTTNKIPSLVLVGQPLQDHPHLSMYKKIRVVIPCQGPSTIPGREGSFHMTAHRGYTIKYPREFGHRHRKAIKIVALWLRRAVRGAETVGGFAGNVSSHPGNLITWGLMSLQLKLSNKSRLQRAGFDFDCVYTPHLVTEEHQRKALEELLHESAASSGERNITGDLRGIVRENGETIWVCDQCHDCIQRGLPIVESNILTLPQYLPLVRRGPKVEVTLHNTTSVSIFTETFIKPSKTEEMIIHIDPTYFEAPERSTGAPFNSIVQLFEELGQALQGQKSLKRLEIHCNSQSGEMYSGLKAVFNCRSLESLVVSGIPCFLQNHIPMKFRRLKDLTFQGVNVAMGAAAANFKAMRIMNPGLLVLVI